MWGPLSLSFHPAPAVGGESAADLPLRRVLGPRPEACAVLSVDYLPSVARRVERLFIRENHRSPEGQVRKELKLPPDDLQSGRPVPLGQQTPLSGYPPAQAPVLEDTEIRRNGETSLTAATLLIKSNVYCS